jgi:hypothetical protein
MIATSSATKESADERSVRLGFSCVFALHLDERPSHLDDQGPISVLFASPVSNVGGFFTYAVPLSIEAFDINNISLGILNSTFSNNLLLSGDFGSLPNEHLQFALGGISKVTIAGDPGGTSFVVDDLAYTSSASSVPEPSTIGLILLGGVLIRVVRRRSNHSVVDN